MYEYCIIMYYCLHVEKINEKLSDLLKFSISNQKYFSSRRL